VKSLFNFLAHQIISHTSLQIHWEKPFLIFKNNTWALSLLMFVTVEFKKEC